MRRASSADKHPIALATDLKSLLKQLKDFDFSDVSTTKELSMEDILHKMTETKDKARKELQEQRPEAKYVPPGGWKEETLMGRSSSLAWKLEQKAKQKKLSLRTIAAFRNNDSKWDRSSTLDAELQRSIYRTPCRDPTGIVYKNLGREKYTGSNVWKPTSTVNSIPETSIELLTESFRHQLLDHITNVVTSEQEIYEHMPIGTEAQRNLKAKFGADLNNLNLVRSQLLHSIESIEKEEAEKHELLQTMRQTKLEMKKKELDEKAARHTQHLLERERQRKIQEEIENAYESEEDSDFDSEEEDMMGLNMAALKKEEKESEENENEEPQTSHTPPHVDENVPVAQSHLSDYHK